ncbi:MAG: dihydroorotase, partial [Sphingobacteriales bacterium]
VVEAEGLAVSPGWVDVFADYREPGYEQKETLESGLRCAAAGGFTDVLLAPNTNPSISSKSTVQYILQKARGNKVNIHPLGSISQQIEGKSLAEMLDMHAHGAIAFTDGWKPVQNPGLMLKALEYVRSFDGVLMQLPIDLALSAGGLMHEGEVSTSLGMPGVPALAETIILHRDIELLRYTGSRLHISGVSTAEGVAMIRKAKAEGLNITCSVTPYHLVLTDEALRTYDSVFKVSPVLRSEVDRLGLVMGLKDGTIDCIASHHRPQEWDSKAKEFEYAGDGMNIQELSFPLVYAALAGLVPLERIIDAFAVRPRKIFGLSTESIGENVRMPLSVFRTSGSWTFNAGSTASKSGNNPFQGTVFEASVIDVINNN